MLSRKIGESIVVGPDIVITVVDLGRGRVQIGIDAPRHVPVYRHEIHERMVARGELEEAGMAAG